MKRIYFQHLQRQQSIEHSFQQIFYTKTMQFQRLQFTEASRVKAIWRNIGDDAGVLNRQFDHISTSGKPIISHFVVWKMYSFNCETIVETKRFLSWEQFWLGPYGGTTHVIIRRNLFCTFDCKFWTSNANICCEVFVHLIWQSFIESKWQLLRGELHLKIKEFINELPIMIEKKRNTSIYWPLDHWTVLQAPRKTKCHWNSRKSNK